MGQLGQGQAIVIWKSQDPSPGQMALTMHSHLARQRSRDMSLSLSLGSHTSSLTASLRGLFLSPKAYPLWKSLFQNIMALPLRILSPGGPEQSTKLAEPQPFLLNGKVSPGSRTQGLSLRQSSLMGKKRGNQAGKESPGEGNKLPGNSNPSSIPVPACNQAHFPVLPNPLHCDSQE